jgi:alkylation response protein AidB-like acyl-CoA dehydrogenase
VRLDGVRVPPQRALGSPGNVAAALDRALDESITALAAEMVGTCQALFDLTLEYAKHREQFGQPIGAFQATQHKFADLFIALEKARSTVLFSAMTLAEEDERRPLAAATAKVAAGDCQHRLAKEGIQIHGGLGYTWEQDVHLYVKRIQSGEKLLGTSAWHRARIADFLGI